MVEVSSESGWYAFDLLIFRFDEVVEWVLDDGLVQMSAEKAFY